MSKASFSLLALATVALGITVYWDQQRIADLESALASTHRGSTELTIQGEKDRKEIRQLHEQVSIFKAESEDLRQRLAHPESAKPQDPAKATDTAAKETEPKKAAPQDFMKGIAKMFTDPELRKSMRPQQLMGMRMLYADLGKALGLNADETNQLMEILTDRQMALSSQAMAKMAPDGKTGGANTAAESIDETKKRYDEQLAGTLGPEKYKQFQNYEKSVTDRFMLQQFDGQFSAAGFPLESAQKEKLLSAIGEERSRLPKEAGGGARSSDPQKQLQMLQSDKGIDEAVAHQEKLNQKVLERARDILNADQVVVLQKAQQQQLEMIRAQMKMSRTMLGLEK